MDNHVALISIKIDGTKLDAITHDSLLSFKISASIASSSVAKLVFSDKRATLQEKNTFDMGKSITISIKTDKEAVEVFTGDITRMDYIFTDGETDKIQLICYDGLHRLSKIWHSRAFVKMKLSDIATKMAGEAKLTKNKIDATTEAIEHLYQNNQSNLDFLRMYAKQIGYEVGMDGAGLLFAKARYKTKVKSNIVLEWGENLFYLNAKVDSSDVLVEVVVSSWDPNTKENIESSVKSGAEDKVASPKNLGAAIVKSKLKSEAKLYRLDFPSLTVAGAKAIATSHLTQSSMNYLKVEGLCMGEPAFKLGTMLDIEGVGAKISGEYYISAYEHIYGENGYKTSFEVQANGTY